MTPMIPMNKLATQLRHIGLRALPANLDDFLARATKARWSPHMLLEQLAQAQAEERSRHSLERRLRISGIKRFLSRWFCRGPCFGCSTGFSKWAKSFVNFRAGARHQGRIRPQHGTQSACTSEGA